MKKEEVIAKAKKFVATESGYSDEILGSSWEYAMLLTHRRKEQIEMYEYVLELLADTIVIMDNTINEKNFNQQHHEKN